MVVKNMINKGIKTKYRASRRCRCINSTAAKTIKMLRIFLRYEGRMLKNIHIGFMLTPILLSSLTVEKETRASDANIKNENMIKFNAMITCLSPSWKDKGSQMPALYNPPAFRLMNC